MSSPTVDLSEALKRRRLELRLSLGQLARRAGSSPAAIHRYESGWHRFELYTLQKLATALGCRLRIDLQPVSGPAPSRSQKAAANRLRRLFWDKRLEETDLQEHPQWVIRRVLETGCLRDLQDLLGLMGRKRFLGYVAGLRFASERVEGFWRAMLQQEGVRCRGRSSPRAARISWLK